MTAGAGARFLLLGCMMLLAACRPPAAPPAATPAPTVTTRTEHPNGLILALPAGYRATQQPDGFVVEEDPPAQRRMALRVDVRLITATAPLPSAGRHTVAPGRDFGWALRSAESTGSGGAEYTLTACEALGGQRTLCLVQTKLGKHGAPDFEIWQVAAGATVRP